MRRANQLAQRLTCILWLAGTGGCIVPDRGEQGLVGFSRDGKTRWQTVCGDQAVRGHPRLGDVAAAFRGNSPSSYDERHNAVIFTDGNYPWAYRYKR